MRPAGESFRSRVPVLLLLEPHTRRLDWARRGVAVFGLDRFAVGYDVSVWRAADRYCLTIVVH